jgi:hypothetical protein
MLQHFLTPNLSRHQDKRSEMFRRIYIYIYHSSLPTDWSFPLKYKNYVFVESPSNVIALAKLIEETRPELVYPVHNAGMGGAYFFMTRYFGDKFYDELIELCENLSIPLDMGEPP